MPGVLEWTSEPCGATPTAWAFYGNLIGVKVNATRLIAGNNARINRRNIEFN